jgi:hypothetical protein
MAVSVMTAMQQRSGACAVEGFEAKLSKIEERVVVRPRSLRGRRFCHAGLDPASTARRAWKLKCETAITAELAPSMTLHAAWMPDQVRHDNACFSAAPTPRPGR